VVLLVVFMKPDDGTSAKPRSAAQSDDGWADMKTATQFVGPDPERVANMMSIYTMGGEVKFGKGADHPVIALRIHSPHATDSMMNVIRSYHTVKDLDVSSCPITDDGLQYFYTLAELEHINLTYTKVTNQGVLNMHTARPKTKIDF
jgi:hypothetical protein